jgi:tripartite ATP-independent transporter DctM subunit
VSAQWVGLIGMATLVVMIMIRIPVAVALALVGVSGYAALEGWHKAFVVLGGVPLELGSGYALSVVPLFALMGALATTAGLSADLFRAANVAFAGLRGALAMATIGACAAFGAVCGSSLATAATMSRVSIPEMRDAGYHPRLAAGAVAAGGTLGILIPPSLILLIYAIIAQQSVTKLFAAALIPGLVLTALYLGVIAGMGWLRPEWAPKPPAAARRNIKGKVVTVLRIWHIALLFLLTLGGIYLGWFSPTEAAAIGAFGALALGLVLRKITIRQSAACFAETIRISGSLFLIVMGSMIFSYFVVQTRVSVAMIEWIKDIGVGPTLLMLLLVVFYIFLGCFLEGIGMILVTVPIFFPLVVESGFDPVWFGVLLVIVVEIGLIHPPVGMNLFVLRAQAPEISLGDMYMGVLPFLAAPFALIILLIAFPEIALWLPAQLE